MSVILIGFLIFGLFSGFSAKTAEASNNYIDNIKFYKSGDWYMVDFRVKTTFSVKYDTWWGHYCAFYFSSPNETLTVRTNKTTLPLQLITCEGEQGEYTFTAGQTYHLRFVNVSEGFIFNSNDYIEQIYLYKNGIYIFRDLEYYYFTEYPSLTINYPFEGAEISGVFNIQGSYTLPEGSTFDKLLAYFGYEEAPEEVYFYEFYQDVSPPSGDVSIRVSGVPAGEYLLGFSFINSNDAEDYYIILTWYNITIVEGSPPELPETQETPPFIFNLLEPEIYYSNNSNYASSTALFDNLSGAISPLILTIGNNLTFFSSKFNQDNAKDTGEKIGNGVLIIRSYANNLNSFFNDLPISEILFLYLILLVVVAVFRIVRNLINLIKL
ncbi:MAG: hypothetical protein PHO28_03915 [Candidatus Pacebacteria bacterium]|nr:hypothetical protein [Candidatus Paceibacterota bacterium]